MNLPDSYVVGQEYAVNRNIPILIKCYFSTPFVDNSLSYIEENLSIYFEDINLVLELEVCVNDIFLTDIKNVYFFILGFIYENAIYKLNEKLFEWKYMRGQIIVKELTRFNIDAIEIIHKNTHECLHTFPPIVDSYFPKSARLSNEGNKIYIRDFINTISECLYLNFEDSIRRGISTLETLFIERGLSGTFNEKRKELICCKNYCLDDNCLKVLNRNVWIVYQFRNAIVHNETRALCDKDWNNLCHKLIGTLQYVLNWCQLLPENERNYIFSITQHYLFHANGKFPNIDKIKFDLQHKGEGVALENVQQLNEFMFSGLKISKDDVLACGVSIDFDKFN